MIDKPQIATVIIITADSESVRATENMEKREQFLPKFMKLPFGPFKLEDFRFNNVGKYIIPIATDNQ